MNTIRSGFLPTVLVLWGFGALSRKIQFGTSCSGLFQIAEIQYIWQYCEHVDFPTMGGSIHSFRTDIISQGLGKGMENRKLVITEQQICKEKSVSELSAWVLLLRYIPFYNINKSLSFFTFILPPPPPTPGYLVAIKCPGFWLMELWVWLPPGAWMSISCECCLLSGRGLCNRLITSPELVRASRPPIQWYWKLFLSSKTAGTWSWLAIFISCWGSAIATPVWLRGVHWDKCTVPVNLPFVYKTFIRVVQLSCYRSKSAPDRNQVLKFSPYLTPPPPPPKKKVSVIMLIRLMGALENYLCLFVGTCLLGVRIALPIILLVRRHGVVV